MFCPYTSRSTDRIKLRIVCTYARSEDYTEPKLRDALLGAKCPKMHRGRGPLLMQPWIDVEQYGHVRCW
jgi:hypothetical protein